MEKICSFFGHREVFKDLSEALEQAINEAISAYGITTFYVGGHGEFDKQAARAVRAAKRNYPQIKLVLILPYFTNKLNAYKEDYESYYDNIIIPIELADVHPKSAITKRNRWMVDESKVIICYIQRDFGGAFDAVNYASKKVRIVIKI
ncbi:MAG: DUF1273 family protein [Clostridia bacterium]|nr:DUF1273 family protein [Clostridia bacterium]